MRQLFKKVLEIVFPNHCLACNKMIGLEGLFCNDDWQKLRFITEPKCKICSQPFATEIEVADENDNAPLCYKCLTTKPSYDSSITIFCYNDLLKKIIGDMKYRDATSLSKKFGKMLWQKIAPEIQNYNLIIAVPLHKRRLRERRFNQSALLVKAIIQNAKNNLKSSDKRSRLLPKFYPDILLRTKYTAAQVKLNRKMREKNLRGAFTINKKYHNKLNDTKILLIDDVMTTGATLENCALELKKAGANYITVVTVARTILG